MINGRCQDCDRPAIDCARPGPFLTIDCRLVHAIAKIIRITDEVAIRYDALSRRDAVGVTEADEVCPDRSQCRRPTPDRADG